MRCSAYGMCFFDAVVYIYYKVRHRTSFIKPEEADLSDAVLFDLCDTVWQDLDEKRALKKRNWFKRTVDRYFTS